MCEVKIVPMTREDVPQVFQIEKSFFSIPWKEQDFYDLLPKEEYFFLVAKQEEKVLGYLGAAINGTRSFWRIFSIDPVGVMSRLIGGAISFDAYTYNSGICGFCDPYS